MKYARLIITTFLCFLFFQLVYAFASHQGYQDTVETSISKVENRLALDLPKLRLANPRFNTVAHTTSVRQYIDAINQQLSALNAPVRLIQLQAVQHDVQAQGKISQFILSTNDRDIQVKVLGINQPWSQYLSLYPLLAAFLCFLGLRLQANYEDKADNDAHLGQMPAEPALIINLHDKTIANGIDDKASALSNKPFCFYMALLHYCVDNPSPKLNHNKNVPDELIALANKYFYRLIELGHTKRKRPDFSTNLDKTLSEIRAALDDVFHDFPEEKDKYYPPKAQGEGSRSKLHNYALENLNREKMQFIGK